jgi:hypothetical protein
MKTQTDLLFVPKIIINDILNTGGTIKGSAVLTKRYFFILADKIDGGKKINIPAYDSNYVNNAVANPDDIELAIFEAEMLSKTDSEMIIPTSDFDMFSVQVGFGAFGGLRFKRKGLKVQSGSVNNKQIRQEIKDFYEHLIKK